MGLWRMAGAVALAACGMAASPASAQFFIQSHDFSGEPVKGDEPGMIVQPLPGATPEELRAGLTWTLRAALNVAALQCDFAPTLTTVDNYNATIRDHSAELKNAFDTLTKYFTRTAKSKAAGQTALDQFGTRTYSGFATVAAQYGFCQTASSIAREAVFAPRGTLSEVAERRMRELRNSLVPYGEQRFPRYLARQGTSTPLPSLDPRCWTKKGDWNRKKCGNQNWPPVGVGMAAR